MSVNAGQRHVPSTPQNMQCYAVDATLSLLCHTLNNCKNKVFCEEGKTRIAERIVDTATEIYMKAYAANKIRVTNQTMRDARSIRQTDAIIHCNELIALINAAKRIYHLRRGKTEFWVQKIIETRELLKRWHVADAKRYK